MADIIEQLNALQTRLAEDVERDKAQRDVFVSTMDASLRHLSSLTGVPYEGIEIRERDGSLTVA